MITTAITSGMMGIIYSIAIYSMGKDIINPKKDGIVSWLFIAYVVCCVGLVVTGVIMLLNGIAINGKQL